MATTTAQQQECPRRHLKLTTTVIQSQVVKWEACHPTIREHQTSLCMFSHQCTIDTHLPTNTTCMACHPVAMINNGECLLLKDSQVKSEDQPLSLAMVALRLPNNQDR